MNLYVFEPRDPLVLGDGRLAQGDMRSLRFPWPSSIAGMVRTQIGQDKGGAFFLSPEEALKLREISVQGPFLVQICSQKPLTGELQIEDIFFPMPSDSVFLYHAEDRKHVLRRYRLGIIDHQGITNLPENMKLVGPLGELPSGKPSASPSYINLEGMKRWLSSPPEMWETWKESDGLNSLDTEIRVHVSIDEETRTAAEGKLFCTESVVFTKKNSGKFRRFGLLFICNDVRLLEKKSKLAQLGGERRFGFIHKVKDILPSCPDFRETRRLRLILATPGLFSQGYRPSDQIFNGEAKIIAAAVGRPQAFSGWDFIQKAPKPSQRMAPAGSVYWVELGQGVSAQNFARKWWLNSLCEDPQNAKDGFGICLVGVQ